MGCGIFERLTFPFSKFLLAFLFPFTADGDGATQPLVRPSTPVAGPSSSRTTDICESDPELEQCSNTATTSASGSGSFPRPPSPVLPRRKSSGSGIPRGTEFNPRARLGLNRKNSGPGTDSSNEKEIRKKSLTWVEPEKEGNCSKTENEKSTFEKRRASRKSFDATLQMPSTTESDRFGKTLLYKLSCFFAFSFLFLTLPHLLQ